jgi:hypothetical protein
MMECSNEKDLQDITRDFGMSKKDFLGKEGEAFALSAYSQIIQGLVKDKYFGQSEPDLSTLKQHISFVKEVFDGLDGDQKKSFLQANKGIGSILGVS